MVCWQAKSAKEALERVESDAPELMLTDLVLGKSSGLELLAEVKKRSPLTEVALMSAYGTIESAVQAMRLGAYDFVVKPFRVEEFRLILERMVEKVQLTRENELLRGLRREVRNWSPRRSAPIWKSWNGLLCSEFLSRSPEIKNRRRNCWEFHGRRCIASSSVMGYGRGRRNTEGAEQKTQCCGAADDTLVSKLR